MTISRLFPADGKKVFKLFCEFAKEDSYYIAAAGSTDIEYYISQIFDGCIEEIVNCGDSFGIFENDELIGFVLGFDIHFLESINKEIYGRMFYQADVLRKYLEHFTSNVYYIVGFGIKHEYRNKGIMYKALHQMIKEVGSAYTYVSDAVSEPCFKLFKKLNFEIVNYYSRIFIVKLYGRMV